MQAKSKDIAMKKVPIYQIHRLVCRVSLALCVMLLAGCEVNNVDLTHAHNFVVEYIMLTVIINKKIKEQRIEKEVQNEN